jgi:hypothetical protein
MKKCHFSLRWIGWISTLLIVAALAGVLLVPRLSSAQQPEPPPAPEAQQGLQDRGGTLEPSA